MKKLKWEDDGTFAWATRKKSGIGSAYYAIQKNQYTPSRIRILALVRVVDVDTGDESEEFLLGGNTVEQLQAVALEHYNRKKK